MTEFKSPATSDKTTSNPEKEQPVLSPVAQSKSGKRLRLRPSIFWSVRRGIPTWLKIVMPILGIGIPLLLWFILSVNFRVLPDQSGIGAVGDQAPIATSFIKDIFLPTPGEALSKGIELFKDDELIIDVLASASRVLGGFLAAALISIPVGLLMGTFESIERLLTPFVSAVRYMPVAAFVPLIVIWAGIGESAKIIIVFMGIVLYNIAMIIDTVKGIPNEILNAAYTLGSNRIVLLSKVIFPAALPGILNTMRVNIAGAWNFLILAELLAAEKGLGFTIIRSQRYLQTDKVIFCILIIGLIGLTTDFALKMLGKALTPWTEERQY